MRYKGEQLISYMNKGNVPILRRYKGSELVHLSGNMIKAIPTMTGTASPSPFNVSASNQLSATYAGWKVFDGNQATYWSTTANSYPTSSSWPYLVIDLGTARKICKISIRATYAPTAPARFFIQASNSLSSGFTTQYTRTNKVAMEGWSDDNDTFEFIWTQDTAYRYWSVTIREVGGGDRLQINNMQFYYLQ